MLEACSTLTGVVFYESWRVEIHKLEDDLLVLTTTSIEPSSGYAVNSRKLEDARVLRTISAGAPCIFIYIYIYIYVDLCKVRGEWFSNFVATILYAFQDPCYYTTS